jgi:hypothetical protein
MHRYIMEVQSRYRIAKLRAARNGTRSGDGDITSLMQDLDKRHYLWFMTRGMVGRCRLTL